MTDQIRLSNEGPETHWKAICAAMQRGDWDRVEQLGAEMFRDMEEADEPARMGKAEDAVFGQEDAVAEFSHRALVGTGKSGFRHGISGTINIDADDQIATIVSDDVQFKDSSGNLLLRMTPTYVEFYTDSFRIRDFADSLDVLRIFDFSGWKYELTQLTESASGSEPTVRWDATSKRLEK